MFTRFLVYLLIFSWGIVIGLALPFVFNISYFIEKKSFLNPETITVNTPPTPTPQNQNNRAYQSFTEHIFFICQPKGKATTAKLATQNNDLGIRIREKRTDFKLNLQSTMCDISDRGSISLNFVNKPSRRSKMTSWVHIDNNEFASVNASDNNLSSVPGIAVKAYIDNDCDGELGCAVGKTAGVSLIGEKIQTLPTGERLRIWTQIDSVVRANDKRLIEFIETHGRLIEGPGRVKYIKQQVNNALLVETFSSDLTAPNDGGMSYADFITALLQSVSFDEEYLSL